MVFNLKSIKSIAWLLLLGLGVLVFVFAFISGTEDLGMWKNFPNTLPWLGLIFLTWLARKNPVSGGLLIFLYGLGIVYFFNFNGPNFFVSTFIMTLLIPILGFIILLCGYLILNREKPADKTQ